MPIRLRKIQHSKVNSEDIRQQREKKNILWQRIRKIIVFLILISLLIYIYFEYYASLSGIVIMRASIDHINSPLDAQIKWIVDSKHRKHLQVGEKLAVLHEISINTIDDEERLQKKQLELNEAELRVNEIKTRKNILINNSTQKIIALSLSVELAEKAMKRGLNQIDKAKKIFDAREKELKNARRLWNLDALTKGDLSAAERVFADADAAYKNSLLSEESLKNEYNSAIRSLKAFEDSFKNERDHFDMQITTAELQVNQIKKEVMHIKRVIDGASERDIIIKSPTSGYLVSNSLGKGDFLRKGETILDIYSMASLTIMAYVPENDRYRIHLKQKAKVKIAGRIIQAEVSEIYPRVLPAPPQLSIQGMAARTVYYVKVELQTKEPLGDLLPGQTGRVIFK